MADKVLENNQVSIVGEIVSDFSYSHEVYGEGFFVVEVAVNRLSNYADYIPLMVSERLIDTVDGAPDLAGLLWTAGIGDLWHGFPLGKIQGQVFSGIFDRSFSITGL